MHPANPIRRRTMKKTLFTTALALVLAIGGITASLYAASGPVDPKTTQKYIAKSLEIASKSADMNLSTNLVKIPTVDGKSFGYLLESSNKFVSLGDVVNSSDAIPYNETIRFGYGVESSDGPLFEPRTVSLSVSSDPGYYASFGTDGFYKLDFSENPFDGKIEIYVVGEPLPAPAVTLIVALAAGALFLLYKNRRQRSIQTEQA